MSDENGKDETGKSNAELWGRVLSRLRAELGEQIFKSWFKNLALASVTKRRVCLTAPTPFIRDWIESHYLSRILSHWQDESKQQGGDEKETVRRIDIELDPDWQAGTPQAKPRIQPVPQMRATEPQNEDTDAVSSQGEGAGVGAVTSGRAVGVPLDARLTFDNFIVGKSNELAYAAARRLTEASEISFNPLFLYGGVGLGKTHLMQAIAWDIHHKSPHRKVLYLSAEKFMVQFIHALRFKDTMAFKQQFREVDVLMIDDIQFIVGKDRTQEEFFHTFNALMEHNRQLIISADRSPSDIEGIEERISSRLSAGLVADIHATDYELRLGILQSKQKLLGGDVHVPQDVLAFLAQRIVTNIRELEGALKRLVAYASVQGQPISLEMAREGLRDLLRASERRVTIDEIQRRVADYYGLKLSDLLSPRRARAVARPRQVAMYLAKHLTARSLPEIGGKFGGRDHTTVIHAVKRIDELRASDASLDEDVKILRAMFEN